MGLCRFVRRCGIRGTSLGVPFLWLAACRPLQPRLVCMFLLGSFAPCACIGRAVPVTASAVNKKKKHSFMYLFGALVPEAFRPALTARTLEPVVAGHYGQGERPGAATVRAVVLSRKGIAWLFTCGPCWDSAHLDF